MCDYVSMRSILLKNKIMEPQVLSAYRSGNLTLQDLQTETSPLNEIYSKTYKYLDYPELSDSEKKTISLVKPTDITRPIPNDYQMSNFIAKNAISMEDAGRSMMRKR